MKRVPLLVAVLLAVIPFAAGQTQTRDPGSSDGRPTPAAESTAVRNRVVSKAKVSNHVQKQNPNEERKDAASLEPRPNAGSNQSDQQSWGNTAVANNAITKEKPSASKLEASERIITQPELSSRTRPKLVQPTAMITGVPSVRSVDPPAKTSVRASATSRAVSTVRTSAPLMTYRVGIGDVLDIRLTNIPTRESTLFTVLSGGMVEYPLLSGPVNVDGLTTDEIASLLRNQIKVIDDARVTVSVRDYASHSVVVTGMVDSPGKKILRSEAMPLYTVLAEALPRAEATGATIVRAGKNQSLSLADQQSMSTLVMSGDVIKVSGGFASPKRFLYVGGDVARGGEKEFREGMTLTQALLAAGGAPRGTRASVKIARRNVSGFLVTNEYNLQAIEAGKSPDPVLEAGDRIEVARGVW